MKDRNDRETCSEAQLIDEDSHKNVRNLHVFKQQQKNKNSTFARFEHAIFLCSFCPSFL